MQHRFLSANIVMESRSCTWISHWGSMVQNQTITNNKLHRFQNLFISIALHSFIARRRVYTATWNRNLQAMQSFWSKVVLRICIFRAIGQCRWRAAYLPLICCMSYILVEFGWFLSIIERNRWFNGAKITGSSIYECGRFPLLRPRH